MQIHSIQYNLSLDKLLFSPSLLPAKLNNKSNKFGGFDPLVKKNKAKWKVVTVSAAASSSGSVPAAPLWDTWSPDKATPSPSLSDVLWPSLGMFLFLPHILFDYITYNDMLPSKTFGSIYPSKNLKNNTLIFNH